MEKGEGKKGKSEPPPEWPSLGCNLRQRSAFMNRKDGHWTMTGSMKIIIMKPLHSLDTATIPTFD